LTQFLDVVASRRLAAIGFATAFLAALALLAGGAPGSGAATGDTVHIRGVVYSFFGIDEHAPGAVIRVDEFPGISAPVALDGSYDIEVPDNANVTLYADTPPTYTQTYLQTFRTSGEDIEKAHFQLPRDWHYNAFGNLLEIPRDDDGVAEDCVIVSTFSIHEARDATEFDPGFKDVYPHGLPGSTAAPSPRAPGIKGAFYFDYKPVIIPNAERTESSQDGGVLWTEVPPGYYWMQAEHPTERIAPFLAHCENGRIINASPPWGFYQLKEGEQPDPAAMAEAPDVTVKAAVAKRAVARRRGKRRTVSIVIRAGESLKARMVVTRGKARSGASRLIRMKAGRRVVTAVLRRSARRGFSRVTIYLADDLGNRTVVRRFVRVPR
jgi:hypothetical protein